MVHLHPEAVEAHQASRVLPAWATNCLKIGFPALMWLADARWSPTPPSTVQGFRRWTTVRPSGCGPYSNRSRPMSPASGSWRIHHPGRPGIRDTLAPADLLSLLENCRHVDLYFRAPSGKTLRSKPDVEKYIKGEGRDRSTSVSAMRMHGGETAPGSAHRPARPLWQFGLTVSSTARGPSASGGSAPPGPPLVVWHHASGLLFARRTPPAPFRSL